MWTLKMMLEQFKEKTGLEIEKVLEHRRIEWSEKEKENLIVFRVKGKVSPAFIVYNEDGLKLNGFIFACSRYALKDL